MFKALADPTRRSIIERLGTGPLSVDVLSPYYKMSAPAITKHLNVLERARLIRRIKQSRNVTIVLEPKHFATLTTWVATYTKFWNTKLDHLEKQLLNK
jgi:DNA-binding transcriptional ArsR family regulator